MHHNEECRVGRCIVISDTKKKLREAIFFLKQLGLVVAQTDGPLEHAEFYFSAFFSAARSVTFVLEAERPDVYTEFSDKWRAGLTVAEQSLFSRFTFARNYALKRVTPSVDLDRAKSKLDPYSGLPPELRFFFSEDEDHQMPGYRVLTGKLKPGEPTVELLPLCREYASLLERLVGDFEASHSDD